MFSLMSLVLVSAIYKLGAAVHPDQQRQIDGRIIGGTNTTIVAFPWQVSLQINGTHSCGGSIYSRDLIITAAHCVENNAPQMMKVRAGSTYWSSGGIIVDVAAFKIHENFNGQNSSHDIALIRLAKLLNYCIDIRPISMATVQPENGANAVVSGWGTTFYGASDLPSILQFINVNIIDSKQCASSSYYYGNEIDASMICAAALGKDPCQRDSGGPMVSGGLLVGVVSWGTGCGIPRFPGVYANIALLSDWIVKAAHSV